MISAIQFIGTQRSGSNLLRVMLNQLPEVSAPHPPHILKTFFPLLSQYGNLNNADNFYQLATDVAAWVNLNPVPWEGVRFQADQILKMCRANTLMEILRVIYETKAREDCARYWCCKSMESISYVNEIEMSGIKPVYIHIYRDGRDVALSFLKAIVGPKHIYHLAKKWTEEQELSLSLRASIPESRFISVKYEELIEFPAQVMKSICDKLKVVYQEDVIMDYFHSAESLNTARSGAMWSNLTRPVMKDNHGKYLRELTSEQLRIFEYVAGDMLDKLGYPRAVPVEGFEITEQDIQYFNTENSRLSKEALQRADPEDIQKRLPQEELLKRIQTRKVIIH